MEEIVRAFNFVIEKGWVGGILVPRSLDLYTGDVFLQAFYWATSEWSARDIEEAYRTLRALMTFAL